MVIGSRITLRQKKALIRYKKNKFKRIFFVLLLVWLSSILYLVVNQLLEPDFSLENIDTHLVLRILFRSLIVGVIFSLGEAIRLELKIRRYKSELLDDNPSTDSGKSV